MKIQIVGYETYVPAFELILSSNMELFFSGNKAACELTFGKNLITGHNKGDVCFPLKTSNVIVGAWVHPASGITCTIS